MDGIFITADNEPAPSADERIVFTLDVSGTVKSVNAAGERLTGYELEELRRMNVTDILSTSSAAEIGEQVRRSIRNRVGDVFEVEITTKDGRLLRIETSLDVARCSDGTIEFQGIALPYQRARCLDERFTFSRSLGRGRNLRIVLENPAFPS